MSRVPSECPPASGIASAIRARTVPPPPMKAITLATLSLACVLPKPSAMATEISLFEYAVAVGGATYSPGATLPPSINSSAFAFDTGLGVLTVSVAGAGPHFVGLFLDHEIDEAVNTFFNEHGASSGSIDSKQLWEIGDPFEDDIYNNFLAGSLANKLGPNLDPNGDDVSMALGWRFDLEPSQNALVRFHLSLMPPAITPDFVLTQNDFESAASVHYWSDIRITGDVNPVPDSGPNWLLSLIALAWPVGRRLLSAERRD